MTSHNCFKPFCSIVSCKVEVKTICSHDVIDVRVDQLFFVAVVDTCYVLSFAIIMLNTSLHNPSVKDKPNVDRFISMNRGIHDGGDLPEDLLTVSAAACHQTVHNTHLTSHT